MSWSFTVNGNIDTFTLPVDLIEYMLTQHVEYASDMGYALDLAKRIGLKSATCTGYRTPNPYGGPEVVQISVMGAKEPVDFNDLIRSLIASGPECQHLNVMADQHGLWVCETCGQHVGGASE